tara:strand:- start:3993 stop:4652 length:660 start_codon:yes stop_codon:yes gene_type:complete
MNILQQIGKKTNTDKSRHTYKGLSYLDIYDGHFNSIRHDVKCFVEIGVLSGASVKMWSEYFPNATIYGIDIDPRCKQYETDKIKILIGDQNDDDFLKQAQDELPPIDIFLDDGSHITSHQIKTFEYLNAKITKNGFFVIEDLRNSYDDFNKGCDLRKIWPGMALNKADDDLKNYRADFNDWCFEMIKKLDFHDSNFPLFSLHFYPMILILEHKACKEII